MLKGCTDGQALVLESMSKAIQVEDLSEVPRTKDIKVEQKEGIAVIKSTQDHPENTTKAKRDHTGKDTGERIEEKKMMALGLSGCSNQDHTKEAL